MPDDDSGDNLTGVYDTHDASIRAEALPVPCRCGAKLAYALDAEGQPNGVLHALPMCADFESRDALAFMQWLNAGMREKLHRLRVERARRGARAARIGGRRGRT